MKILVYFFIISNIKLVLSNEKVNEKSVPQQNTYKVHPDSEDTDLEHDEVAESSQKFSQTYLVGGKEVPEENPSQLQTTDHDAQKVQQTMHSPKNLRHGSTASNVEVLEPALSQYNQAPQIYVQQYSLQPIRIFGAEALPYHQMHENEAQKPLGYSSYIEHVSEKDEDINSALKEGAVKDLKRLVPKSGISFKIYPNQKNVNFEDQKTDTQSNVVTHIHSKALPNPHLKYKIKPEVTTKFQATYKEPQLPLIELPNKAREPQHELKNFQQLLQNAGGTSSSQDHAQNLYYAQQEVNSFSNANTKSFSSPQPQFKLSVDENNYSKATQTTRLNSLSTNGNLKHVDNLQYQKQWKFNGKTEELHKALKNVKPIAEEQYEEDLLTQAERTRGFDYSQSHAVQNNFNKLKAASAVVEHGKNNANHLHTNSFSSKVNQNNFDRHLANKAYAENQLVNRLTGNYINDESIKTGQNHVINLESSGYSDSQFYNNGLSQNFAASSIDSSDAAKTGQQHNLISQVSKNLYVETKSGQNNFDHQKALEGSTSFDIKNAIDNAGNLIHQNHISPVPDVHHTDDFQKQQLAYVIPKISPSSVLIGNGVHETPALQGHHIKEFETSSPQIPYHTFSSPELNGKFFHQPTILLASDHTKQENTLTVDDLHQPLIRFHLPKEEVYQHVKDPTLEIPTSSVSHISYQQQKQPYVLHYDLPSVKYPQEFVFQPKLKTRVQNTQASHVKLTQPVTMDWNSLKSALPNFNLHSLGGVKPEIFTAQTNGKKIVPILVRKRKNRSNNKQEVGVIYGKVNSNRRPTKPSQRHEKTIRQNYYPEASSNVNKYEVNGERNNEFSVSASYKVDRSFKTPTRS